MGRVKNEEIEAKWRAQLEGWDASGLSLRAFAEREKLNIHTLWTWKKKLRGVKSPQLRRVKPPPAKGDFVSVVLGRTAPSSSACFVSGR